MLSQGRSAARVTVRTSVLLYAGMSKAFTRESDLPEIVVRPRPTSLLPPGAKNYLTVGGAQELERELDELLSMRSRLTAAAEDGELAEKLQRVDMRIAQLQQTLHSAAIVEPPSAPDDTVRFGATVTVREQDGSECTYRIVGVDETDLERNWISWVSPIAKALLQARAGERVRVKFPSGEQELEILRVSHD